MGINYSVILNLSLAVNLIVGLTVGIVCLLAGGFLFRKLSDRVRSSERTRTREETGPVIGGPDLLGPSRRPGFA